MEALYVWEQGEPADAASAVGHALGVELRLHDSSYYGGDYFRAERGIDQVIVLANYVEDDGEPFFQAAPVGAVCVQVVGFGEERERLRAVPGLRPA